MTTPGSGPVPPDPWPPAPGSGPGPYGQTPSGQHPGVQNPYVQNPHGHDRYGQTAYGYDAPPPAPGTAYPPAGYGTAPPPAGYGVPPTGGAYPPAGGAWGAPPGAVVIPGGPVLQAASPGQRTLARLIDSAGYVVLLGGAIALGIVLLFRSVDDRSQVDYSYGYATPTGDRFPVGILWLYALPLVAGLVILAYESLMIGLTGSPLGGRLRGVRFVRTSDGARPGFGRGLGRSAILAASTFVCYGIVFLLLLLSMFFDQQPGRYQSWIDKLCGLQAVTTKG